MAMCMGIVEAMRHTCVRRTIAILAVLGVACGSAFATTFGEAPTYTSDVGFALDVSPDKKAFTVVFGAFEVQMPGKSPVPMLTRTFSFVLPVSDAELGKEIPFFVSGFAVSESGATGRLLFMVNDQTSVAHFPSDPKGSSFVHEHKYKVGAVSELRFTITVTVDRGTKSEAQGYVNVVAIDSHVLKPHASKTKR